MKRFLCAAILTVGFVGIVMGEEIAVSITKVDADKGTIEYKKYTGTGKNKKLEDTVNKGEIAKGAKILKGMFNKDTKKQEDGDAVENGLKNEAFSSDKGVNATIFTADADEGDAKKGQITKIRIGGKKKAAN